MNGKDYTGEKPEVAIESDQNRFMLLSMNR